MWSLAAAATVFALAAVADPENRVANPGFDLQAGGDTAIGWQPLDQYRIVDGTLLAEPAGPGRSAGAMQVIRCDPPLNEPFTASAEARAEAVGDGGDFALWLDLICDDGSPLWARAAGFARGTHDWQQVCVDVDPPRPIREIRFHLLLRGTTGRAWFRGPRLEPTRPRIERLEAVAGLWGSGSLLVRAETNIDAALVLTAGGGAGEDRSIASAKGRRLKIDLTAGPGEASAKALAVEARSTAHPERAASCVLEPAAVSEAAGPVFAWTTDALTRLFDDSLPPATAGPMELEAVRDGHAAFQVGIIARPDRGPATARVEIGPLKADGGAVFDAGRWKRFCVAFIETLQPAAHPFLERRGPTWWPDPLPVYRPVAVPPGETRAVLLDTRVPPDQPPGLYRGFVTVQSADGPPLRLPVALRVRDFRMPVRPEIKTAFALMDGFLEKIYGTITPQLRRACTAYLLDCRLNPDDISRTTLPDLDELSWAKDRGLNAFNVLNAVPEPQTPATWVCFAPVEAYTEEFKARFLRRLDEVVPELRRRGLLEYAYVYGFDERGEEYLPVIRDLFGAVRARHPGLRTLSTCWPPAGTDPLSLNIDWYCPLSNKYDPAAAEDLRRRGGRMWWYICMGPGYPYANWLFEHPLVEARVIWWQAWMQGVDGFLYWGLNIWDRPRNDAPIPDDADVRLAWSVTPFEPLHGDGVLVYPGSEGLIGSLRLLAIRDGIEDTMLLEAAAGRAGRERVREAARRVAAGMTDFTRDPRVLRAARRELLDLLEAEPTADRTPER